MNIDELVNNYINLGYRRIEANAKVSQDIILNKISKSNFKNNITIKGGVVMHNISKDIRRATRDLDLDFIKYSLADSSIENFINKLNSVNDGIKIEIKNPILQLHHQDYDGKRVNIIIKDNYNNTIESKLDIGVHKLLEIKQDEIFFDLGMIDSEVSLLVNSSEQIFAEKLKSLLKFGGRSTRYKDIFDFYYLIDNKKLDVEKLLKYIDILILNDESMKENSVQDIIVRLQNVFSNRAYIKMINDANNNWLYLSSDMVIKKVLKYIKELSDISIVV